jgi:hypothetical protein
MYQLHENQLDEKQKQHGNKTIQAILDIEPWLILHIKLHIFFL